jgi:hypothetical protein
VPIAVFVLATRSLGIVGIWLALFGWVCLRAGVNRQRVERILQPTVA